MSLAWKVELQPAQKLALLAMCDWANDAGGSLHPSIAAIAVRVGCTDRHAKRILRDLIEAGWISVVGNKNGGAPGQTRHYQINKNKLLTGDAEVTPTGDMDDTPKARKTASTGDMSVTPTGDTSVTGDKSGRVTDEAGTGDTHVPRRVTNEAKRGDTHVTQSTIEPSINHHRSTSNTARSRVTLKKPDDVDEQIWTDWIALRKARKSPVTQTVVDMVRGEAVKAGIGLQEALAISCANGWQGFRASWVTKDSAAAQGHGASARPSRQQAIEDNNRAVAAQWLAQQGAKT
ncbi:helix-turn-helix domain-containing protein [Brachymonas sp. J145]|uniref:helix-turn-helix domain-containing protein n=1 Tax=Brachymonas sp. J145 TaxID=3116489 RepID=UPI002E79A3B2|nr:helix-turn-helix domain-containing protein [Brachymonas sp. J145]MEE1653754.1 helix-turn-helix domain-containing protein [Brachymonas sp. J145]